MIPPTEDLMTVRRITTHPLKVLNGLNELKVPARSHVVSAVAFQNKPDPMKQVAKLTFVRTAIERDGNP